jgi:hypothetical protein
VERERERERDRLAVLLDQIAAEFPRFRVIRKPDSRLQRLIHRALMVVTAGQMRDYLDGYHTTMGQRVYVTADWEERPRDERWLILRHERVHMRQFRRYTRVGMALLYLLVPLPLGLSWFRARFEMEAYAESIRAGAELHGAGHVAAGGFRDRILDQFTGPSYGWMWPFRRSVAHWYDGVVARLADTAEPGV